MLDVLRNNIPNISSWIFFVCHFQLIHFRFVWLKFLLSVRSCCETTCTTLLIIVWFKKTDTHLLLYTVANVSPFFESDVRSRVSSLSNSNSKIGQNWTSENAWKWNQCNLLEDISLYTVIMGRGVLRIKIGHHKIGAWAEIGQNRIRGVGGSKKLKQCRKSFMYVP